MSTIQVVILAAGEGKRMSSSLPKVLHKLGGKPLLAHVIGMAQRIAKSPIVIYGHKGEALKAAFAKDTIHWIEQKEQLGTGHAVLQALPNIADNERVLILYGDVPLISEQTLNKLISATPANAIGMLTAELHNPAGYGRIKRDAQENIIGIIEEKDAVAAEKNINEINSGIYLTPAAYLKKWLPQLQNQNAQKEYYLTDIVALAAKEKIAIHAINPFMNEEIFGVNDCSQLMQLERFYQQKTAEKLMQQGVTIYDPMRLDIRGEVEIGKDVIIDVNVILEGHVVIGDGCVIGPNVLLRDSTLGPNVQIKANSVLEESEIGTESIIGPFARLRPGTKTAAQTHIGNFVEVKNSQIGEASKINHLSYVGDSEVGKRVNIGAGTITCNYDGANKHKTVIGDDVHIGSDTQLVAPVSVGEGATIAAGSTITENVPAGELTVTQTLTQRQIKGWKRPRKK